MHGEVYKLHLNLNLLSTIKLLPNRVTTFLTNTTVSSFYKQYPFFTQFLVIEILSLVNPLNCETQGIAIKYSVSGTRQCSLENLLAFNLEASDVIS